MCDTYVYKRMKRKVILFLIIMTEEIKQKSAVQRLLDEYTQNCEQFPVIESRYKQWYNAFVNYSPVNDNAQMSNFEMINSELKYAQNLWDEWKIKNSELKNKMKQYFDIVINFIKKYKEVPEPELIPFCNNFNEIIDLSIYLCGRDINDSQYDINYYLLKYTNMRLSYYCRTIPTMILLICESDNTTNDSVITFVKTNNVQDLASRTYITSHKSIPPRDIIPSSPSAELIKDASDNLSKEDLKEFMKLMTFN